MNTQEFILDLFRKKDSNNKLNADNILTFNFIENDFFSSIEFIEMIADVEQEFSITFSDAQLKSEQFSIVGGLIQLVESLHLGNKIVENCIN